MLGEVFNQVGAEIEQAAQVLSTQMEPEPQPVVGAPEIVDRAAVSAMSLEAISGVQAGPGMQTSLSPEITANLTVNPATMPWTAKAEMSAAELNSPSPFKTA